MLSRKSSKTSVLGKEPTHSGHSSTMSHKRGVKQPSAPEKCMTGVCINSNTAEPTLIRQF